MTTTITVRTFANPASVGLYGGSGEQRDPHRRSYHHASSTEYLAAQSSKDFTISDNGSINVQELPAEATSLDHADELNSANATSGTRVG